MTGAREPVIGLEVHLQLKTDSKLFCACPVRFPAPPNTLVCPTCLGLPGSLPVPNRAAVRLAVRAALALDCKVHTVSRFERKHYFYPDLPKGYQITQRERPIATGGALRFRSGNSTRTVRVLRLQLEEDSGRTAYRDGTGEALVDFNRCGVPLLEVVTAPELRSADEARAFCEELRRTLLFAGVSDCDMEKGHLRVDANVSLRSGAAEAPGTRTEIKNLNSFSQLEAALRSEISRQVDIIRRGGRVERRTLRFDPKRRRVVVRRGKEAVHDYRYLPEPDIPALVLDETLLKEAGVGLGESPLEMENRFRDEHGVSAGAARVLASRPDLARYYEALRRLAPARQAANWLVTEALRTSGEKQSKSPPSLRVPPEALAALLEMLRRGRITGPVAKRVYRRMAETGASAAEIVAADDLYAQRDAEALVETAEQVLAENPQAVADYRAGKKTALKFLLGRLMRKTRGRAEPETAAEVLRRLLAAGSDPQKTRS